VTTDTDHSRLSFSAPSGLTLRTSFAGVPSFAPNLDSVDQFFVKHPHPGIEQFELVADVVFEGAEAVIHLLKSCGHLLEAPVNLLEAPVNLVEAAVNSLESLVNLLEAPVNLLKSRIHFATERCYLARQCLQGGDGVLESRYSFFQGSSCHRAPCAPASREACAEGVGAKQADDVSIVAWQQQ
jgi:hypothetical protein